MWPRGWDVLQQGLQHQYGPGSKEIEEQVPSEVGLLFVMSHGFVPPCCALPIRQRGFKATQPCRLGGQGDGPLASPTARPKTAGL